MGITVTPQSASEVVLQRVDPETLRVVASLPLGDGGGADVAVNDADVWVSMTDGDRTHVTRVDAYTNEVLTTTPLEGRSPIRIVAVNDAIIVQQEEASAGISSPCDVLTSIDPITAAVIARAPLGDSCTRGTLLAWRDGVWIASDVALLPVDPNTARTSGTGFPFEGDHSPRSFIAADERGVWYGAYPGGDGSAPDRLTWLDPSSGAVHEYMELTNGAFAAALLQDTVWTANRDGTVSRIDLHSD